MLLPPQFAEKSYLTQLFMRRPSRGAPAAQQLEAAGPLRRPRLVAQPPCSAHGLGFGRAELLAHSTKSDTI